MDEQTKNNTSSGFDRREKLNLQTRYQLSKLQNLQQSAICTPVQISSRSATHIVHIQATPKNLILTLTSYPNALLSLRSAKESVSFLSVDKKSTDADFKWGGLPNLHSGAKSAQGELDRLAQDLTTYVNTPLNVQNVLCWTTPAKLNLKLSKYTAFTLAQNFARQVKQLGCSKAEVRMKGLGMVKAYCVRGLRTGLSITRVRDITPVPHNGCRPPKQRRI